MQQILTEGVVVKRPGLAALLNVVPFGIGYLYLGSIGMFAYVLLLAIAAPFAGFLAGSVFLDGAAAAVNHCGSGFSEDCTRPAWAWVLVIVGWALPFGLIASFSARDAHRRAVAENPPPGGTGRREE